MAREMKDSGVEWIGVIPTNWSTVLFGYVADIFGRIGFRGYTADDLVAEGEGPITLSPSNIIDQKLSLKKCSYITWDKYYESPEIQVNHGDIILVKTASVGKCAIYSSSKLATLNPQLVVLKNIKCNSKYLYYSLISDIGQMPIILDNFGSVIPTITQEKLSHYKFLLPSILEQQLIASFLDTKCAEIDKVIEATKSSIDEYKKLRQAIITEAVTKGFDPNVEMKDSGIGDGSKTPIKWKLLSLKRFVKMNSGDNLTSEEIIEGGSYPVYGGNGFRGYYHSYNCSGLHVLIGRQGALAGNIHIVDGEYWATDHAIVVYNNSKIDTQFLYYKLIGMNLNQYAYETAAQPGLAVNKIINLKSVFPISLAEQNTIADYLDTKCAQIDSLIKSKEKLIEELTAYRKSLIYEYVTGKKEVPAV
ncbi:MAG: restriction endonuclease subunit S [Bullifex sp.]